jgi:homocysteine S-methyltransferase
MTTAISTRAKTFRDALAHRVMIVDGAMGTMLYSKGIFINRCFDELNLSSPAIVKEVHQEYVKAGADILETNTFGASRIRLAAFGQAHNLRAINESGVRLAREAAGDSVYVAGAIGPLGVRIEPLGPTSFQEAYDSFFEQASVLVEAGCDLLVLETFTNLDEALQAIAAARAASGADMVIAAHVSVGDDGSMSGTPPDVFTRVLDESEADLIGLNCSTGPKPMLETIERMNAFTHKPLSAMPNAGLPALVEGRHIYLSSPEYMAQYARRFLQAGVKMIGGCCGTTPQHIKEIRSEVRSLQPVTRKLTATVAEPAVLEKALAKVPVADKSTLGEKLAAGKFVAFVEILPPRGVDPSKEVAGAALCRDAGIDCINVPDGPRASARLSAQITCMEIQRQAGIEAVLHFCCRDRNILGIQSELLGAHTLGVRNLICITGDPPRMGTYPDATAVFDVDAIGLVNIVNDEEHRRFEWKVQAGAEYTVTQPVFDLDLLEAFLKRTEQFRLPLIAGIWPLTSYRNAEFMVNELRVPVPEHYMERMRRADTAEKARAEGVAIAREMVERVRPMVQGVQLSAPFGRYQMAIEVAEAIGPRDN